MSGRAADEPEAARARFTAHSLGVWEPPGAGPGLVHRCPAPEAGSVTTLTETLSYLEGRMKDTSGFSVTKLEGLVQRPCWVVGEDPGSGTEDRGGEETEISWGAGAGSCRW